MQQLTELQARYDTLQTAQRNSLVDVMPAPAGHASTPQQQQVVAATQQQHQQLHEQLAGCFKQLQGIASALQDMLRMPGEAVRSTPRSVASSPRHWSRSSSPVVGRHHQQPNVLQLCQLLEHPAVEEECPAVAGVPAPAEQGGDSSHQHVKGEVESHRIQTVTTRVYEGSSSRLITGASGAFTQSVVPADLSGSLAAAAGEAAASARLAHMEFVLAELQELMPVVNSAAAAALKACRESSADAAGGSSVAGGAAAAAVASAQQGGQGQVRESTVLTNLSVLGTLPRPASGLHSSTTDNVEGKQQDQALQTKEAKASLAGACAG